MKIKRLLLTFGLAAIVGIGAFAGLNAKREVRETKADATAVASFARFYFCQGGWSNSSNPILREGTLEGHAEDADVISFVLTETASSYASVSGPDTCYYYADVALAGKTTFHFRFDQGGYHIYPNPHGYSGYIGDNFYPGHIYSIAVGNGVGDPSGSCKWANFTITDLGYFATFNVNGGTRNAGESYDYKEFRTSATLMAAPTKDGYSFLGWEASDTGIVNTAGASFGASSPVVFKAIWHSNALEAVDGNKARVWLGYDSNGDLGSLFYNGVGTEVKLWIHQGDNSAGTEEEIIAAKGTYYNNSENLGGTFTSCPRRYDYFDVPVSYFTNGYYLSLQRFENGAHKKTVPQIQLSNSATWAFKILYANPSWETAPGLSGLAENKTDALFASIALCGIHTCSNNVLNGYAGYSAWNATFLQNVQPSALAAYTINDFANGDTAYAGNKSKEVTAKAKYDAVLAAQGGDGTSTFMLNETNNSGMVIFAIIAVLSIASLALFFLIRKNRKQREE